MQVRSAQPEIGVVAKRNPGSHGRSKREYCLFNWVFQFAVCLSVLILLSMCVGFTRTGERLFQFGNFACAGACTSQEQVTFGVNAAVQLHKAGRRRLWRVITHTRTHTRSSMCHAACGHHTTHNTTQPHNSGLRAC